jgi:hypothetical protein
MFKTFQAWWRRRTLREGKVLTRFIARDIRRDVLIASAARVDAGIVTGRVRTVKVLYIAKGLESQPQFEGARELRIDELWHWTGAGWGGLADGTSATDH